MVGRWMDGRIDRYIDRWTDKRIAGRESRLNTLNNVVRVSTAP